VPEEAIKVFPSLRGKTFSTRLRVRKRNTPGTFGCTLGIALSPEHTRCCATAAGSPAVLAPDARCSLACSLCGTTWLHTPCSLRIAD
jgi:hypothetical protein